MAHKGMGLPGMGAPGGKPKPVSEIMFEKFDKDKSGSIDAGEFQHLCFNLGYALSEAELAFALKTLDGDNSGKIELKEFKEWWRRPERWEELKLDAAQLEVRQQAADVFKTYDKDLQGAISTKDFDKFYGELLGGKLTKKDKATALADLDKNGDGRVQFAEYIEWLQRQGTLSVKVIIEDKKK